MNIVTGFVFIAFRKGEIDKMKKRFKKVVQWKGLEFVVFTLWSMLILWLGHIEDLPTISFLIVVGIIILAFIFLPNVKREVYWEEIKRLRGKEVKGR